MVFFGKPAPDLERQIDMCWFAVSEGRSGKAFYESLPDGNVDLLFRFSSSGCRAFLIGPAREKATVEIDEACDYFQIVFRPGQAPCLADVHPADLADSYVELPKILGESVDSLGERLISLPDFASRQQLVEELMRRERPLVRDERCRQATALVEVCAGRLQVNELASELGIHIRSLERLFLDHLGMTPKLLTRLVRLKHLLAHLNNRTFHNLADLAYVCGYTDQSHMIRDFKKLTGRVPGETGSYCITRLDGPPRTRIVHRCSSSCDPGALRETEEVLR